MTIDQKYKNLIDNKRLEFGNLKHIRAVAIIKEIEILKRTKNKTKGIFKKIDILKSSIIFNLTK